MVYRNSNDAQITVRQDYTKKILLTRDNFKHDGHLLQLVTIPGNTKQRKHVHLQQTEIFYIAAGTPTVVINDVEYAPALGDAFICSPGDSHYIHTKTSDKAEILVLKINYPEEGEDSTWLE